MDLGLNPLYVDGPAWCCVTEFQRNSIYKICHSWCEAWEWTCWGHNDHGCCVVWYEDGPAALVNGKLPWICCRYIWGKCRTVVTDSVCLSVEMLLTRKGLEGHYRTNFGNKLQLSADIMRLGIILEEGEIMEITWGWGRKKAYRAL